jgi:hypothetical protein
MVAVGGVASVVSLAAMVWRASMLGVPRLVSTGTACDGAVQPWTISVLRHVSTDPSLRLNGELGNAVPPGGIPATSLAADRAGQKKTP